MTKLKNLVSENNFLHKLFHWEYWPVWTVYWPVFIYWAYLSLRERSPFFFMAANPGMENGGLFGASKMSIYEKLPKELLPVMKLFQPDASREEIQHWISEQGLTFPLFMKPNVGERGLEVTRVLSLDDIMAWFLAHPVPAIVQDAIRRPVEVGLLYYRLPGHKSGHISSFMLREMLTITGDGKRTLKEIVMEYPRARFQVDRLSKRFADRWEQVVSEGEKIVLEHVGNHCKGATFINVNHLIDKQLLKVFDDLSHHISGQDIFFGRYDIKCDSLEDLKQGKNFSIIELNGVASEPAHIYDPGFKLMEAYRVLLRQWSNIHQISRANHAGGVPYISAIEGFTRFKRYREYLATVKKV